MEFRGFPGSLAHIVAEYGVPMKIVAWLRSDMITVAYLLANPNAIDAQIIPEFGGDIDLDSRVNWDNLSIVLRNPSEVVHKWFMPHSKLVNLRHHMDGICKNPSDWAGILVNQWIVERNKLEWSWRDYIDWPGLSSNPSDWATMILARNPDRISHTICANPSKFAILWMQRCIQMKKASGDDDDADEDINYDELNKNPHPWAVRMVDDFTTRKESETSGNPNPDLIEFIKAGAIAGFTDPDELAMNPNIFEQNKYDVKYVCDELVDHIDQPDRADSQEI